MREAPNGAWRNMSRSLLQFYRLLFLFEQRPLRMVQPRYFEHIWIWPVHFGFMFSLSFNSLSSAVINVWSSEQKVTYFSGKNLFSAVIKVSCKISDFWWIFLAKYNFSQPSSFNQSLNLAMPDSDKGLNFTVLLVLSGLLLIAEICLIYHKVISWATITIRVANL